MKTIYFTLLSFSLAISSIAVNYSTYQSSKQRLDNTKIQLDETIKVKHGELKAVLPKIYDELENCSNSSCVFTQLNYEVKSYILKQYYLLANCKNHIKHLADVDRYMQARFFVAHNFPVATKKKLPLEQKNYYSVITEEFDVLSKMKCNIGTI